MRLGSLWLSTLVMTPVADKTNGETTILFSTYRQRRRERESLGRVLKNGLARNELFPLLLPSSNAVAVNCDFQTLFSLSGLSVVKIWFTALLNYNSLNTNYFQLSSDQFSELFSGSWQHDKLCHTHGRKLQSRSLISFPWTLNENIFCAAWRLFAIRFFFSSVNSYWRFSR